MDKSKKILICAIIIVFIVLILVAILLFNLNKNKEKSKLDKQEQAYINTINNPASVVNGNKPVLVQYETVYLTVKNSLKKYLEYCQEKNSKAIAAIEDKQNNIANIFDTEINKLDSLNIEDMFALNGSTYHQFYIKYYIDNNEEYIELNQDTKNKTFSIIPLSKVEYEDKINTIINGRTGQEKEIEKNEYNEYTPIVLKEEDIAKAYYSDLKEKIILKPDIVYNMIDTEYKSKRFPTSEDFENYIKENIDYIKKSEFSKYLLNTNNGNRMLICIDNNENYYTFNITSALKYTVLLDSYTVDTEEFINQYKQFDDEGKVYANISKFIKCINDKNYYKAYNYLDNSFKNSYFKTIEDFKIYAQNNFYNRIVQDIQIRKDKDIFICTITIRNNNESSATNIKKIINMKLDEGTDFLVTFNM